MTYYIFTLGCQMNVSDSQRIATILESCGFQPVPENEADLIVVNACSVRQKAVDRVYGKLKHWKNKRVFITGCLLLKDRENLEKKVDLIFNIQNLSKLNKWLSSHNSGYESIKDYFQIPPLLPKNEDVAFVPIMTGCDNFCSYCAVPYTRGREVSRPKKEIICELRNLVKRGCKEITLLGQNVNRFKPSFVNLLEKLVKIPGDFKIKFLTSNPWDFSDELIELVAKEPKLSKQIHLPVQSGDDGILRKMNRKYTAVQYLKLIENLKLKIRTCFQQNLVFSPRSKIENLSLSTDIIVGFPGETKKAFENTVKLCQKACFGKAYIAQYSPRPGTLANKEYRDDVTKEEKKRRWQILDKLING